MTLTLAAVLLASRGAAANFNYDPSKSAFVLAQGSHGSINPTFSFNSGGQQNVIQYLGVGDYLVVFPGLAPYLSNGGDVQVTAVASTNRCKVSGWYTNGGDTDINVEVRCFSASGSPNDGEFRASFVERENGTDATGSPLSFQEGGYLWNYDPNSASYTALSGDYNWNSTGQAITVTHPSTGAYTVSFEGQVSDFPFNKPGLSSCAPVPFNNSGGMFMVTAYGSDNHYCRGASFISGNNPLGGPLTQEYISIACFDGTTGAPADSMFDVAYDSMSLNGTIDSAGAIANPATASLPPSWVTGIVTSNDGGTCPHYVAGAPGNAAVTVTRASTGVYTVLFPGLYSVPSIVHTVAVGGGSGTCSNWGTLQVGGNLQLGVRCFSFSGAPADTGFQVTYGATGYLQP